MIPEMLTKKPTANGWRLPTEAEVLQASAIIVAAPRYMGAFASVIGIDILTHWPGFANVEIGSGAAMAVLEGWAVAFMFRRWRVMPTGSPHWWVLLVLQFALMLALPATATPYLLSSQLGQPANEIMPFALLVAWSFTVAAIAPLVLAAVGYSDTKEAATEVEDISSLYSAGFVYVVKLEENGLYKIGRTIHIEERLRGLRDKYKQLCTPVHMFWVPDQYIFEQLALSMTEQYRPSSKDERSELRAMTEQELASFVAEFSSFLKEDASVALPELAEGIRICSGCQRSFPSVQGLNAHKKFCTDPKPEPKLPRKRLSKAGSFACPDCGAAFAKVQGLNAHKQHCPNRVKQTAEVVTNGRVG